MPAEKPVVVVGAGLAGLACAARLHRDGVRVLVLEAGDAVGGRIRTDTVDGFTIDRGFQVLNTAYPALRRAVDLGSLDLRHLPRGVRVRRDGTVHDVPHPLSSVSASWRDLTSSVVAPWSKLALARYAGALLAARPGSIKARRDVPAVEAWSDAVPREVVDALLVPFLSGVVLERELTTSRVFTDLMMRMFATGSSAVPARGMQALPEAVAAALPRDVVRLETPVARAAPFSVFLADGPETPARAVVVATDPWTAHRLVPELGAPPEARGVVTHYFAVPTSDLDGTLVVDADGSGVLNSVVLSASAPEYSADGRSLVATSVLMSEAGAPTEDVVTVAAELHGVDPRGWEHLTTREIPHALPAMTAPHPLRKPVYQPQAGVWVAGDHRDTSSIQGALVSGSRAAAAVLRQSSVGSVAS